MADLTGHGDLPNTNEVIRISSEQSLTISGPGEWETLWLVSLGAGAVYGRGELINNHLTFKILKQEHTTYTYTQPLNRQLQVQDVQLMSELQGYNHWSWRILSSFNQRTESRQLLMCGCELTQILTCGPEAAQSQYLFGLKHMELMVSPASNVYKCLPSFKSQSMAIPS